jgi:hypothetical protein
MDVSASKNARTFELDKRREFWRAHISTFGPSSTPNETSRPVAKGTCTRGDVEDECPTCSRQGAAGRLIRTTGMLEGNVARTFDLLYRVQSLLEAQSAEA